MDVTEGKGKEGQNCNVTHFGRKRRDLIKALKMRTVHWEALDKQSMIEELLPLLTTEQLVEVAGRQNIEIED